MLQLDHPHIVRVLDGPAEHNGFHYFVMELMAGGDLFRAVTKSKINRMEALSALLQVGQALSYAHSRGIVHRDIKPQNILLDGHGTARLTDFDLVWAADDGRHADRRDGHLPVFSAGRDGRCQPHRSAR